MVHREAVVVIPQARSVRCLFVCWALIGHNLSQWDLHPGLELDRVESVGNVVPNYVDRITPLLGVVVAKIIQREGIQHLRFLGGLNLMFFFSISISLYYLNT